MRFPDGIAAQPDVLARSAKALREALPDIPSPHPGEVIALVGIGASEHAARSAAPVWRDQDLRAFAVSASELQRRRAGGGRRLRRRSASPGAAPRPSPRCPTSRTSPGWA